MPPSMRRATDVPEASTPHAQSAHQGTPRVGPSPRGSAVYPLTRAGMISTAVVARQGRHARGDPEDLVCSRMSFTVTTRLAMAHLRSGVSSTPQPWPSPSRHATYQPSHHLGGPRQSLTGQERPRPLRSGVSYAAGAINRADLVEQRELRFGAPR